MPAVGVLERAVLQWRSAVSAQSDTPGYRQQTEHVIKSYLIPNQNPFHVCNRLNLKDFFPFLSLSYIIGLVGSRYGILMKSMTRT